MAERRLEIFGFGVLAFTVCLIARLWSLDDLSYWLDEIITSEAALRDWGALVRNRLQHGHSPFYFGVIKFFHLGRSAEFMLRLPSAVFDSLAAGLFVVVARQLSGRVGGAVMIVLYTFTPLFIDYGQEARPWAMLLFFVGLATLGYGILISGLSRDRRTVWGAFATATIGCIGAGLTLTAGWLTVAILQTAALLQLRPRNDRHLLRLWGAHVAVTWLAIAPLVVGLMDNLQRAREKHWTASWAPVNLSTVSDLAQTLYLMTNNIDPNRLVPGRGAVVASVLLLSFAMISLLWHRARPMIRFVAFVAISIPLALLALSTIQSTLVPRYFLSSLPFLHLLMSDGAVIVVHWRSVLGGAFVAAACAGTIMQGVETLMSERKFDVKPLVHFLKQHDTGEKKYVAILGAVPLRGDPLVNDRHFSRILRYYLGPHFTVEPLRRRTAAGELADYLVRMPTLTVLARGIERADLDAFFPPSAVVCQWTYRDIDIVVIARDWQSLPAGLKECEKHNGILPGVSAASSLLDR